MKYNCSDVQGELPTINNCKITGEDVKKFLWMRLRRNNRNYALKG